MYEEFETVETYGDMKKNALRKILPQEMVT